MMGEKTRESARVRVVLTGAPGSGKSDIFERLRTLDSLRDFLFFPELARELLTATPSLRARRDEFHRLLYEAHVRREESALELSFITDRGTVDIFAFHPETVARMHTSLEQEYARYDIVFHLGSAAALPGDYYLTDTVRTETAAEALEVERFTRNVWQMHPAYRFVPARTDFEEKYGVVREELLTFCKRTGVWTGE